MSVRRWDSGNARLAPLSAHGQQVLYAGERHLGRIDPARQEPVWHVAHGLPSDAVFRPRAAGPLVLCAGLGEIGAWTLADGERRWRHAAQVQLGVPWVTQEYTYVGDGHELLAMDNASGQVRWRHAGTPDTITAYAPVLSGQTLMVAPGNGVLYALDASRGQLKWKLDLSHEWQYLRQLHVSGEVLVAGSYKEMLYGISVSDGRVLWKFNAGNFINSHHVAGDTTYLWSPTGWVYAIDTRSGQMRWRHRTTDYRSDGTGWGPLVAELVKRKVAITSTMTVFETFTPGRPMPPGIDVLTPRAQGKMLRVLEERVFRRVGGTRENRVDARFVASAAPDLPRRVRTGEFREDLYYRLAVLTVKLPALAERRGDVLPAARALLREAGGPFAFTPAAVKALRSHPFRGSFRELENVVRRAVLEARARGADAVDEPHLGLLSASDPEALLAAASRSSWSLRRLTDAYVALVLDEAGGNVAEAARRLGVARKTLYARK